MESPILDSKTKIHETTYGFFFLILSKSMMIQKGEMNLLWGKLLMGKYLPQVLKYFY